MKVRTTAALAALALVAATATLLLITNPTAHAAPLGPSIPAWCVEHTSFSHGPDVPGDYRCAGLAIEYHTAGVAYSPFPIWAGQWLFTDPEGQYRVGYCTYNRGHHPTVAVPSQVVSQALPNDPGGARTAYLAWRYGDTQDALTAAALWAVFHHYAQDAAGSNRAVNATAPLVASLDGLLLRSGRDDLQQRALELDSEAASLGGDWTLALTLGTPTADGLSATLTLLAGTHPVPGREITVHVSGDDQPVSATTGTDGTATVTVHGPLSPGTVTVVATTSAPGPALVYRGTPAAPDPHGAQYLVTAGTPRTLRAEATVDVGEPPTTTAATTTTAAPTTTAPAPTTTEPATTTSAPTSTGAPTTTVASEAPTSTVPATVANAPTTSAAVPPPLPRTGGGAGDSGVAYVGTALLVAGVGLVGTIRRRPPHTA